MMKFCFVVCIIGLFFSSCSSTYYVKRGDAIYGTGRFYKAVSKYEKAYNKTKSKEYQVVAALRAGQACENVNRLKEALGWYRRAVRSGKENPEVYQKLAQTALRLDDTGAVREYYREYEELFADGKGQDGIYHLEQVSKDMSEQGRYCVDLKREFNSRYSDFAPVYSPGDTCVVYFASTRNPSVKARRMKKEPVTGEGYSHIYRADFVSEVRSVDKSGQVKVKRFKEPRWLAPVLLKDSLYSTRHEGAICFEDEKNMYFTSSRVVKGSHIGTRIYKASQESKEEEGAAKTVWSKVIPSGICGDSVSLGHPALTPDGNRMYFVTDALPGGFGGKDIWYVEKNEEKWGEPVNAGELVNTEGDEMFPYVRENGELYFASNGRYGFGGLDIYKVEKQDDREVVVHLPAPLNSVADDFGLIYKPGSEDGLLTSARSGRGDHIYAFSFIPQQLQVKVLVVNSITERPVIKGQLAITADDGSVFYLETDSLGVAGMPVVADKEYVFVAEHPQYLKGKGTISTYREKSDRLYELSISMQPIEKPIVIPNIYFDVARWDLREDAMKNLEVLLQILNDNPNIAIELSAHTDMVGNDRANMVLSENRATSVVAYLIEKGVYWDRLVAKGYGETQPRQINEREAKTYSFLKVGDQLTQNLVNRLKGTEKETAMQLNRRIEFKVLRTNYKPSAHSSQRPTQQLVGVPSDGSVDREEGKSEKTQLKPLSDVKGRFYTLQLGVFKNVPSLIYQFRVVFTDKLKSGGVRYCVGVYDNRKEATEAAKQLKEKGTDCLIKEFEQ